jgi:phosphopantothenoylcysteine decarboxylase / phosphopantothenate---cysteine ligase
VRRIDVRSALEMQGALSSVLGGELDAADALIMTAAVADYRAAFPSETKLKRSGNAMTLELVPNPDLLAEIGGKRHGRRPVLVGFAVETESDEALVALAQGKLASKRVDVIVANHAADSFGRDDNRATLVDQHGSEPLGILTKLELADRILNRVARLCRP